MDHQLLRAIGILARQLPEALPAAFGQKSPPEPPPPVPMPDINDPAVLAARSRVLDEAAVRSGRASTILSGRGSDYSGTKLGAA